MRNLIEYPVTEKEITDLLMELKQVCEAEYPKIIGDMRPVLLEQARQIVHAAYEMGMELDERSEQRAPMRWVTPWKAATALVRVLRGESVYA